MHSVVRIGGIMALLLATVSAAHADTSVKEIVLQQGLFLDKSGDCAKARTFKEGEFDACKCDANIRYPELSGLKDAKAQSVLNADFKAAAQKAACPGKAVSEDGSVTASRHYSYDITLQSPQIIGLFFTDYTETGGMHGDREVKGVIVDIKTGKPLTIADIIDTKNLTAANDAIYNALIARNSDDLYRKTVEDMKGTFITQTECNGCTLALYPDGLRVVFQTYKVGSYVEGNIDVTIPPQFISNAAIAGVLQPQTVQAPPQ